MELAAALLLDFLTFVGFYCYTWHHQAHLWHHCSIHHRHHSTKSTYGKLAPLSIAQSTTDTIATARLYQHLLLPAARSSHVHQILLPGTTKLANPPLAPSQGEQIFWYGFMVAAIISYMISYFYAFYVFIWRILYFFQAVVL